MGDSPSLERSPAVQREAVLALKESRRVSVYIISRKPTS